MFFLDRENFQKSLLELRDHFEILYKQPLIAPYIQINANFRLYKKIHPLLYYFSIKSISL